MTNIRNAVKGWQLRSVDLEATSIAANAVGNSEISAAAVRNAKISDLTIAGAKISAGAVIQAKLGAAAVGNAALSAAAVKPAAISAGAVKTAAISAGTIVNADLSSPESIMHIRFRDRQLATSTAILANQNYVTMDRCALPIAATLHKAEAWASQAAPAASSIRIRVANASGTELLTGSGIVVSAAATVRSGAISTAVAAQGARSVIVCKTWSSTTFSLLGPLYVDTWWKVAHTT